MGPRIAHHVTPRMRVFLLGWVAATLAVNQLSAATYYVRVSGSDYNSGTSAATAYRTIKKAANMAHAGDTVWVGAGTYSDAVTVAYAGTSSNPIKFMADTNGAKTGDAGQVIVSGYSTYFLIYFKDYVTVNGFRFVGKGRYNSTDTAILIYYGSNGGVIQNCEFVNGYDGIYLISADVTITGCKSDNHTQNGLVLWGTSKMLLQSSTVSNCDSRGVYINDATNVTIETTTISGNADHGIRTEADATTDVLLVRQCKIINNKDGIHIHGNSKITIENTMIGNNRESGVRNHAGDGNVTLNHCTLAYNEFDGLDNDEGNFTCKATNCIFAYNEDDGIDTAGTKFTHSYNLSYGNWSQNWEGTWSTTGCVSADPKFVSSTDYHLKAGSAAIDKGTGTMAVARDGTERPMGAAVDIGCEEGMGGGGPPPPGSRDYYVRITGSDAKSGTIPANAFRTIAKAVSVVVPGDEVWVGAGTYTESPDISAKIGTSAGPIKFNADTDGAKTGDAGTVNVAGGFYLQNSAYITINGFAIQVNTTKPTWALYTAGVYVQDSPNITLTGLTTSGGKYGVGSWTSTDLAIDTSIASGATSHGFAFFSGTTASVGSCQSISNTQAGFYSNAANIQITDCNTASNTSRGFQILVSEGAVANSASSSDGMAGEFSGVNGDPGSLNISKLTVENSQNRVVLATCCTADVRGGTLPMCGAGAYAVYADNAMLTLRNAVISGTQYGVQAVNDSDIHLTNCQFSSLQYDGAYFIGGATSLSNCLVTGCRYAIRGENNATLAASSCTFSTTSNWAVSHTGYGSITDCIVQNSMQGLNLVGATTRGDITLSNTVVDAITKEGVSATRCTGSLLGGSGKLSNGGDYGVYLLDSDLTLTSVQVAGPKYGFKAYSSNLGIVGLTLSGCQFDGLYADASNTTLSNAMISTCNNGVLSENNSALAVSNSTFNNNTAWAIHHAGTGSVTGCTINNNYQGVYLAGTNTMGDVTLASTTIQGTTKEGLALIKGTGTIAGGSDKLSKGGSYGAYLSQSNLTMSNIQITGPANGIMSYSSTLSLGDSTIENATQAGLYAEGSTLTLVNSTLTGCGTRGVDCQLDSNLTATSCKVENCSDWGLALAGLGTITNCELNNNTKGATLTGKLTRGDIKFTNLKINECANQGLSAVRCEGTVIGGTSNLSNAGSAGIYSNDSKLTVTNATVSGSTNGVQSTLSDLTLRDCKVTGATNAVSSDNDQNLLLERVRLQNSTAWGLRQVKGLSQITNCLITNNPSGIYFENTSQANLWSTTVVCTGQYGVYQTAGLADLKNTIITGNNQGVGLYRGGGVMSVSHNLVHGFTTNFSGVTPDADMVTTNPRFTNALSGDYSLAPGSPAINAGDDLLGYADADIAGTPRPTKLRWEIGAYESTLEGASLRILQWTEKK